MKVAFGQFMTVTDEILRFSAQLGAPGVIVSGARGLASTTPAEISNLNAVSAESPTTFERSSPGFEFLDLVHLRTRCEQHGLRLEAIEDVPVSFYDRAMLGETGRDEQITRIQAIIRNIGRAEIPIFGIHWMLSGVWRTSTSHRGRGGARVTAYDHDIALRAPPTHSREVSEEEAWENFAYFIKAIVPTAEEAGVTLALHPDDPPVPSLGGVARIFRSTEAMLRALEIADSPAFQVLFCLGTWSEMKEDHLEALRLLTEMDKIAYVHCRDVKGTVPFFEEAFPDEGNTDLLAALRILRDGGFTGCLIDDHVPLVEGDQGWGFRARAFCTGYIAGLVEAVLGGASSPVVEATAASASRRTEPSVGQA